MDVSELVRGLLVKRGIVTDEHIATFLNPDYDLHTHSPFLLEGMDKAVARLLRAIEKNERIAVYADFDCDGIPGAALLSDFFQKIGYANLPDGKAGFEVYLPHRDREGYGFHIEAIEALAERGVKLIITVDVGTTAVEAIAFAKDKGVDVIVTDHHEIVSELPAAVAILNPKLGEYPFRDLCGAAVAFKLVHATLIEGRKRATPRFAAIPEGWEKWLLDLVAIATIADMVPLVGENRVLAHYGLRVLRKSPRPGILALFNRLRLHRAELTEDDIGFSIAPRINAASRMGEPELAFRLLSTHDADGAEQLAAQLEDLNAKRKTAVATIVRAAKKHVATRFRSDERVITLGDTSWKPALLGLAANSIMGERGGIVCLWGRDAKGRLKGSCRSDGSVSVIELFALAADSFEEYGGHAASCGFSVSHEKVHSLHETLSDALNKMIAPDAPGGARLRRGSGEAKADAELSLSDVAWSLFEDVTRLAPFGMGNRKPIFRIGGNIVTEVRRFGKEKGHIEVMLECRTTGTKARAFDFFASSEDFTMPPVAGTEAFVLGTIERDSFRGGLAVRLVDILPLERDTIAA